jgi:Putative DNA-binding domain
MHGSRGSFTVRALLELQADFAAAILDQDADAVAGLIAPDGLPPGGRVQIYWHHVFSSLTEALESTYPVVCQLVDRRFFGFAADRYVRSRPPEAPCLFEYGGSFPEFLENFPPCAGHPYLADVARLEWAMNVALHAEDVLPIAPAVLAQVPPGDVGRLAFRLDPSAGWLESPWPIDRIWRANQPEVDLDARVDLAAGGVALEVRRRDGAPTFRPVAWAEFAFRSALGSGASLATAADSASRGEPRFDLTAALGALIEEELLIGFTPARAKGDAR